MNPETEELEAAFLHFPAGTNRLEVWHWFDDRYSKGVSFLLYGIQADSRRCEIVWDIQKQNDIEDVQSYIDQLTDDEIRQEYRMERETLCKLVPTAASALLPRHGLFSTNSQWRHEGQEVHGHCG